MNMRNLWLADDLPNPGVLIRDLERMIQAATRNVGPEPGTYPPLDVSRDGQRCYVRAIVPGVEPDDLKVSVERNKVTISGQRTISPESAGKDGRGGDTAPSYHRQERAGGSFSRTLTLDADFDTDAVAASYRNGILTVELPLTSAAKARLIPVQTT